MAIKKRYLSLLAGVCLLTACSDRGALAIFKKLSPHDQYGQRIKDAGLNTSAMGNLWLQRSQESLNKALSITVPYQETGYFAAEKVPVTVFRLEAKRGQLLRVSLSMRPVSNFKIYADLFQTGPDQPELVASADTTGHLLTYEIKKTGSYLLRLQPELLVSGEYTLKITAGPSLGFPVSAAGRPHIGSFWNDDRDAGERKHEGIDIFAIKGSPAIATNDGVVTRVTENTLGGKVVFMRPDNRDYNLYYAHLDLQTARDGQTVHAGDTLGLVGNTGNAKNTPSHLHFGIYTSQGAVDPLPFVNREIKQPLPITVSLDLDVIQITTGKARFYAAADEKTFITLGERTPLYIQAASAALYKVSLPDGRTGYVHAKDSRKAKPLHTLAIIPGAALYDAPDTSAARKLILTEKAQVQLLGAFGNFELVAYRDTTGWIAK
jgi:murein DD-endopeptidase MepM/ murein hydrolase activator NlpD